MIDLEGDDETIISIIIGVLETLDQFCDINYIKDNIGTIIYSFDNV